MSGRIIFAAILAAFVTAAAGQPQSAPKPGKPQSQNALDTIAASIAAGDLVSARGRLRELPPRQRQSARGLLLEATILNREGDLRESLKLAFASLEKNPGDPAAHQLFALNTARLGKPDLAEPYFRQAVALAPNDPQARYHLGVNQIDLKRPNEAIEQLSRAIELDPESLDTRCALGLAHELTGDFSTAKRIYQEAIAVRERRRAGPAAPYLYLARLLVADDQASQAAAILERAVEANPNGFDEWYEYGRALARLDDAQKALAALDKAAALDPTAAQPHYQRMQVLKKLGRQSEARQAAELFERLRGVRQPVSPPADPR